MPPAARIRAFLWIVLLLALALLGCQPRGFRCDGEVCIRLEIEQPVQVLKPALATVTVKTRSDASKFGVSLLGDAKGSVVLQDPLGNPADAKIAYRDKRSVDWNIDTRGGEEYAFSAYVIFPPATAGGTASWKVRALASHPRMGVVSSSVRIYLDAEGRQVERSQAPGPEIVLPATVVTSPPGPSRTPRPTRTPAPTFTPRPTRAPTLAPTATPTATPAPLRQAYPAPTDAGHLAPAQRAATPAYPQPE